MWRRWFLPLVVLLLGAWLTIRGAQAQPLPPGSGSGSLAVVTFSPAQAGTTTLALQQAQSTDAPGALIPVESEDGFATVVAALSGDVDGDCDVDVVDIMLVAARWDATVGEPGYDLRCDLDGDGDVDVVDITLVASHWGEDCTATPTPTPTPTPARLTCPTATALEELVACIISQGPYSEGAGYVEPSSTVKGDWQTVVSAMMNGSCDFALPASLAPVMTIRTFADSDNRRDYCVLYETADADLNGKVDKGWGTFITYNASNKALVIHYPHPVFDMTTENEAITVFKETSARAFLLMGAHRHASSVPACQSGYHISDPAHDVRDVFNPTVVELRSYFGSNPYWVIQFHGMAVDSCSENVYMSNGFTTLPPTGTKIWQLYEAMHADHPTWSIALTGQGSCSLSGAASPTGRIIHGVPITSACNTNATTNTGYFIHIEQDPNNRTAGDWIPAINTVWP